MNVITKALLETLQDRKLMQEICKGCEHQPDCDDRETYCNDYIEEALERGLKCPSP